MNQKNWQELRFESTRDSVEPLEDWLFEQGAVAITLEDNADDPLLEPGPGETPLWHQVKVTALFAECIDLMPIIENVPRGLVIYTHDNRPTHVKGKDWERVWIDDFKPMRMGNRLWICPSWAPPPEPEAVNVLLDPGLAFGTGAHPTTAMCLAELDRVIEPGMQVVDYGCGTGILAIAAIKLGAARALGVDNDPQAITASHQNAERNTISTRLFETVMPESTAITQWQQTADVVIANILAAPLAQLAEELLTLMKPGGRLVLAGLLSKQADNLITHYKPYISLKAVNSTEDWTLLSGSSPL